MFKMVLSLLVIVSCSLGAAVSAELPSKATYVFYIQGEYAGKCAMDINEDGDLLIFESTTQLKFDDFDLDLTARTEIEKATLRLHFYKYDGIRMGKTVSGTLWSDGDSLSADNVMDGEHFQSGARMEGPVYLFDNYVSEHQIIMTWAIDQAKEPFLRFTVLLPSEFMTFATVSALDSEIEYPTTPKPSVCKKYGISMKNSGAYYTYYDPKRKIPVYLDFPSAMTEVFLEGTFDGKPQTKYVRPEEPE
jgi:hypothetical protein